MQLASGLRRAFSTERTLLQLTNPINKHKVWRQALAAWPTEKWRSLLTPDPAVAEHQRAFAGILQSHGPMNHYYLLKEHPAIAPELLLLIVDATSVFPYAQPQHREMDLIKVLRQMALATSEDSMVATAKRALTDLAAMPSDDSGLLPLYKSLASAAFEQDDVTAACLDDIVSTLLQHDRIATALAVLRYVQDETNLPPPKRTLTKLFRHLGRRADADAGSVAAALALASDWDAPTDKAVAGAMLAACLRAQLLPDALAVFHAAPAGSWGEPDVHALATALSIDAQHKAALEALFEQSAPVHSQRLLTTFLLAAQQMATPNLLQKALARCTARGWSVAVLCSCADHAPPSPHHDQLAATLLLHQLQAAPADASAVLARFLAAVKSYRTWLRVANLVLAQRVRDAPAEAVAIYAALFVAGKHEEHVRGSFHAVLLGLAAHGHVDEVLELLAFAKAHAIKPRADDLATIAVNLAASDSAAVHARPVLAMYLDILGSMRLPMTLRIWAAMAQLASAANDAALALDVYEAMRERRIKPTEAIVLDVLRAARPNFDLFQHVYADAMAHNVRSTRLFGLVLKVACYQHDPVFLRRVLSDIAANAWASSDAAVVATA
ncbi:hypothetical protein ACHHYP_02703 [Achlya hypogyna]|uniref:Pentacotripeptide-repeat region of PRORP domain-containing protein n=1 Tax=Achlya hypogyna TaxID=1202772 RepID=A0A1V9ZS33_ACHHY|nr:hypothetical protein ACHHYP_02703 [Achlya hypogyna]